MAEVDRNSPFLAADYVNAIQHLFNESPQWRADAIAPSRELSQSCRALALPAVAARLILATLENERSRLPA